MAQTYKILGQINPTSNVMTNVYVTGSNESAVVNTIYFCNQIAFSSNISLIIRPINEVLANKHFYVFEQPVAAADSLVLNLGVTMGPDTILAANATFGPAGFTPDFSINAFGLEID